MDGLVPETNSAAEAHLLELLFAKSNKTASNTPHSGKRSRKKNELKAAELSDRKTSKNKGINAENDCMPDHDTDEKRNSDAFIVSDGKKKVTGSNAPGFVVGSANESVNSTQLEKQHSKAKTGKGRQRARKRQPSSSSSSSSSGESSRQSSDENERTKPVVKKHADSPVANLSQQAAENLKINKKASKNAGESSNVNQRSRLLADFVCDSDDDDDAGKTMQAKKSEQSRNDAENSRSNAKSKSSAADAAAKKHNMRFAPIISSDDEDSDDDPFSALESASKVFTDHRRDSNKHAKTDAPTSKSKTSATEHASATRRASNSDDDDSSDENDAAASFSANAMLATGRRIGGYGKQENLAPSRGVYKSVDTSAGSGGKIMQTAKRQLGMMKNPMTNKPLTAGQWNQLSLEQRRVALLSKEVASDACSSTSAGAVSGGGGHMYFSASYAKKSGRKHKVFEKDGFLRVITEKGGITLLDCSGQRVDSRGGVPQAVLRNLEGGELIVIGEHDVQLVDALSAAEFESQKQVGLGSLCSDQNGAAEDSGGKKFKW